MLDQAICSPLTSGIGGSGSVILVVSVCIVVRGHAGDLESVECHGGCQGGAGSIVRRISRGYVSRVYPRL